MNKEYIKGALIGKGVRVRPSTVHGYGVFATKKFLPGDVIEECPLIMLKKSEPIFVLNDFAFKWNDDFHALALGYGSLYNHANDNNTKHYHDHDRRLLIFKAKKTIYPGDEIFTNYSREWFTARGVEIIEPSKKINRRRLIRFLVGLGILIIIWAIISSGRFVL